MFTILGQAISGGGADKSLIEMFFEYGPSWALNAGFLALIFKVADFWMKKESESNKGLLKFLTDSAKEHSRQNNILELRTRETQSINRTLEEIRDWVRAYEKRLQKEGRGVDSGILRTGRTEPPHA